MKFIALGLFLASAVALFEDAMAGDLFASGLGHVPKAQETRSIFD